jgi:hypothetical protein
MQRGAHAPLPLVELIQNQAPRPYVFSKRAAFFNGLKSKVGHMMAEAAAEAAALRVNLNLTPSFPSAPRPHTRKSHAHLIHVSLLDYEVFHALKLILII